MPPDTFTHLLTQPPFAGVLPVRQSVQQVGTSTHSLITFATNQATRPACSGCGQRVEPIHSYHVRRVRDLSLAQARVDLDIPHRKVRCPDCGIRIEAHVFLDPFRRSTRRFEQAVEDLCRYLPIKQVAEHFGLSWHTVKEIDKRRLLREVGTPCYDGLRLLAIDEISVHKGHRYMTTVLDFQPFSGERGRERTGHGSKPWWPRNNHRHQRGSEWNRPDHGPIHDRLIRANEGVG